MFVVKRARRYSIILSLIAVTGACEKAPGQTKLLTSRSIETNDFTNIEQLIASPSGNMFALEFSDGILLIDRDANVIQEIPLPDRTLLQGFVQEDELLAYSNRREVFRIDAQKGTIERVGSWTAPEDKTYRSTTAAGVFSIDRNYAYMPIHVDQYVEGQPPRQLAGWNIDTSSPGPLIPASSTVFRSWASNTQVVAWIAPSSFDQFDLNVHTEKASGTETLPLGASIAALRTETHVSADASGFAVAQADNSIRYLLEFSKQDTGIVTSVKKLSDLATSHRSMISLPGVEFGGSINVLPPFDVLDTSPMTERLINKLRAELPDNAVILQDVHVDVSDDFAIGLLETTAGKNALLVWREGELQLHHLYDNAEIKRAPRSWATLRTSAGETPYWIFEPPGEVEGTLIHFHGGPAASASRTDEQLVAPWLEKNYRVIMPEISGSTRYGGEHTRRIYNFSFEDLSAETSEFIELAHELLPDKPIGLSGNSFGGFAVAASLAATDKEISFIALDAPLLSVCHMLQERTADQRSRNRFYRSPNEASNRLTMLAYAEEHCEIDQGSREPKIRAPANSMIEPSLRSVQRKARETPIWILAGERDELIRSDFVEDFFETLEKRDCTRIQVIPEQGHTTINYPQRATSITDLIECATP